MEDQEMVQEAAGEKQPTIQNDKAGKLGTLGWGLFFIWIGIGFLAELDIGISLIGIGVITLVIQLLRRSFSLAIEGFWFVVGVLFIIGGIWTQYEPDIPLIAIVLIVAGLLLLVSAMRKKKK
ncbi:MAG: hypothetical protein V3V99_12800 [candidate division Zixibacteria bacterium]